MNFDMERIAAECWQHHKAAQMKRTARKLEGPNQDDEDVEVLRASLRSDLATPDTQQSLQPSVPSNSYTKLIPGRTTITTRRGMAPSPTPSLMFPEDETPESNVMEADESTYAPSTARQSVAVQTPLSYRPSPRKLRPQERKRYASDSSDSEPPTARSPKRYRFLVYTSDRGIVEHAKTVLAAAEGYEAEDADCGPDSPTTYTKQQQEVAEVGQPFPSEIGSTTRLMVSMDSKPGWGPVSVPPQGCNNMEELFQTLRSERSLERYLDSEVDLVTVTFPNLKTCEGSTGRSQLLRLWSQEDWLDFCEMVQASWEAHCSGGRHEIGVYIHLKPPTRPES